MGGCIVCEREVHPIRAIRRRSSLPSGAAGAIRSWDGVCRGPFATRLRPYPGVKLTLKRCVVGALARRSRRLSLQPAIHKACTLSTATGTEGTATSPAMAVSYGLVAAPVTYAVHVLGVVAIALVLFWTLHYRGGLAWDSINKNLVFNLHPVLMIGGFVFVSSEAILIYKTIGGNKQVRKGWHLGLQLLALVLGIVGIWTAFRYHNESTPAIDNLYSLHSWLGLSAAVLFGIQWIFGFLTFWYPGGSPGLRRLSLPWHVFLGLFVYVLALAASLTGILEKITFLQNSQVFGHYDFEPLLVNSLGLVVVVFGALVVLATLLPQSGPQEEGYAPIE